MAGVGNITCMGRNLKLSYIILLEAYGWGRKYNLHGWKFRFELYYTARGLWLGKEL